MVKRGLGILDMACLLEIGKNTVLRFIRRLGQSISAPVLYETGQEYESDEFYTQIRGPLKQEIYVAYIINSQCRQVINFHVGPRNKISLGNMLMPVLQSAPKKIFTDGWSSYKCVIPEKLHCKRKYRINRIERNHLTLRTRIKRVSGNFMNQSRSLEMLVAYLRVYFWG